MVQKVGYRFVGRVEDALFLDEAEIRVFIRPEAFGYTSGQRVTGSLTFTGPAADIVDSTPENSPSTVPAGSNVDFFFPQTRVGDWHEDDLRPPGAPVVGFDRTSTDHPVVGVNYTLFSDDDPDGPTGRSSLQFGGTHFTDDDDSEAYVYGAWIPDGLKVREVVGGTGADHITTAPRSGDSAAFVWGRAGDDAIQITKGDAIVWAGQGDDTVRDSGNGNTLFGGFGEDRIEGRGGEDTILGEYGNDTLLGGDGGDLIYGNQGADRILGDGGADRLFGDDSADTILGGSGRDTLFGGLGDDRLDGGQGNDVLEGDGPDLSADTFVFAAGQGNDTVNDFAYGEGDRLDLQGQGYALGTGPGGVAVLTLSGGGTVTLLGLTPAEFQADFVL